MARQTQKELVLEYLKTHKGLTSLQACRWKKPITRIGAIIFNLRMDGHRIYAIPIPQEHGAPYARYELATV